MYQAPRNTLPWSMCAALACAIAWPSSKAEVDTGLLVTPLIAGQNINIGSVQCGVDPAQPNKGACVGSATAGWCLSLVHLYVGLDSPPTMAPGQFPYKRSLNGCQNQVRLDFILPSLCRGQSYYLAFHAEASGPGRNETAWGQGAPTGRNWSMVTRLTCKPEDT
jgi:hypothetical protein